MITGIPKITHILFATDLSENANHAFAYATSLANAYNAAITVLHVIEKMPPNAEILISAFLECPSLEEFRKKSEAELIEQIKARIERFCLAVADRIPECRFMLRNVMVEPGVASKRILSHMATGTYDALVMGCRGLSPIRLFTPGGRSGRIYPL